MRACEKKVLHLRHPESGIFDEVYFVLREDMEKAPSRRDMVEEAARIIRKETQERDAVKAKKRRGRLLYPCLVGSLGTACAVMLILLLFF